MLFKNISLAKMTLFLTQQTFCNNLYEQLRTTNIYESVRKSKFYLRKCS